MLSLICATNWLQKRRQNKIARLIKNNLIGIDDKTLFCTARVSSDNKRLIFVTSKPLKGNFHSLSTVSWLFIDEIIELTIPLLLLVRLCR